MSYELMIFYSSLIILIILMSVMLKKKSRVFDRVILGISKGSLEKIKFTCAFKVIDTSEILSKLNYDFMKYTEEGSKPKRSKVKFFDIIPSWKNIETGRISEIKEAYLYKHQFEALQSLEKRRNIILISGTGSGKTEAWALYASKNKLKAIAIYPTLALSEDQINRLEEYYASLGLKVVRIDRSIINLFKKEKGLTNSEIRGLIEEAHLVITNPAFLVAELKRLAKRMAGRRVNLYLGDYLKNANLIVIDELDYYTPRQAVMLFKGIEWLLENFYSNDMPQIAVLTATLSNPEDVKEYLEEVTERETIIISGKPFKVENRGYIILGRNLEKVWRKLKEVAEKLKGIEPETAKILREVTEDLETFKRSIPELISLIEESEILKKFVSIEEFRSIPEEILAQYVLGEEDGVTLVFTPSIRSCERLMRRIRERLPEHLKDKVASHHHLIGREERRALEEKARRGEIKIIVSVRTLLQGIDIGIAVRVVHYGLPQSLREFYQREGRKGRREIIPFTETLVFPITTWDRKMLEMGAEALRKWTELPLEKLYLNFGNKYALLFKALLKVVSGQNLEEEEISILKELKLVEEIRTSLITGGVRKIFCLSEDGKRVWDSINFYEYGRPYGLKRTLREDRTRKDLEEISLRDFIEKFQVGCFDVSSDALVIRTLGVQAIEEIPLGTIYSESSRNPWLREAIHRYMAVKNAWNEEKNLYKDFISGKLYSEVDYHILIFHEGFGIFHEYPLTTKWIVESRRPSIVRTPTGEIRFLPRVQSILIREGTRGRYQDFTYAYLYEIDPSIDIRRLRLGLTYLIASLRESKVFALPIDELGYEVIGLKGGKKLLKVWENRCTGLIEFLDERKLWDDMRKVVLEHKPTSITEVLLRQIREEDAIYMLLNDIQWEEVKEYALKAIDHLEGVITLRLREVYDKAGKYIKIPRPSKELKLLAIDAVGIELAGNRLMIVIGLFDGEKCKSFIGKTQPDQISLDFWIKSEFRSFYEEISNYIAFDYKIIYYDEESVKLIYELGYKPLKVLLKSYVNKEHAICLSTLMREVLAKVNPEIKEFSLEDVERAFKEVFEELPPIDIISLNNVTNALARWQRRKLRKEEFESILRKYIESNARRLYYFNLMIKAIEDLTNIER